MGSYWISCDLMAIWDHGGGMRDLIGYMLANMLESTEILVEFRKTCWLARVSSQFIRSFLSFMTFFLRAFSVPDWHPHTYFVDLLMLVLIAHQLPKILENVQIAHATLQTWKHHVVVFLTPNWNNGMDKRYYIWICGFQDPTWSEPYNVKNWFGIEVFSSVPVSFQFKVVLLEYLFIVRTWVATNLVHWPKKNFGSSTLSVYGWNLAEIGFSEILILEAGHDVK
jgi:hypothetical protein